MHVFRKVFPAALCAAAALCPSPAPASATPLRVAVSIAPQAYFVERIAGPLARVEAMVPPGAEEETYAPSPRQLAALFDARLYVALGHPTFLFEERTLLPLLRAHPEIRLIAQARALPPGEVTDPHIWLAPAPVVLAARQIAGALIALDPPHRGVYTANLAAFERDLSALDAAFRRAAAGPRPPRFLTYHPAWGWLDHTYGFRQLAVEAGGKEPGAAAFVALVAAARRDHVRLVLAQPGAAPRLIAALAAASGARVLDVDYMARDWLAMMRRLAAALEEAVHG